MSMCEWDPERGMPATELHETRWVGDRMEKVLVERCGCPNEAAIILGADGQWRLCASCAELPRFRRFRVARVIGSCVKLRRDSVGWWIDGELVKPAPLAEVVASALLPCCPDHDRHPLLRPSPLGGELLCYVCPAGGCLVSGVSAATEALAAEGWRDVID